jgi:spore maturation protein CgeB
MNFRMLVGRLIRRSRILCIPAARNAALRVWLRQNRQRLRAKAAQSSSPKVLYVDTLSLPQALGNVMGIQKAYEKVASVELLDYRRLANTLGPELMNAILYHTAKLFQPDLIHLGKSESVQGLTVRNIKEQIETCVIHFYGDFRPEPQPWVVDIGQHADWTLLYHKDKDLVEKHRALGVRRVGFWWAGTDPEVFRPHKTARRYDVVFMANNTRDYTEKSGQGYAGRLELIRAVSARGIDLHLFGNGWRNMTRTVHVHPFVSNEEFAEVCSASKITLGHNTDQVYMYTSWRRPLCSMACGAFHLTRKFPGLDEVFEDRKHLVWFRSIPEAIQLIEYYLSHDDERDRIAEAGREEVLAHHTWDRRIGDMLQYMAAVNRRNGE